MSVLDVKEPKDEDRQDEQDAQGQVGQEHVLVKVVLERLSREPFRDGDAHQVDRVDRQKREETEHHPQELLEA